MQKNFSIRTCRLFLAANGKNSLHRFSAAEDEKADIQMHKADYLKVFIKMLNVKLLNP